MLSDGWEQLRGQLLRTLGVYAPLSGPIVFDPHFTKNSRSLSTLQHELIHQLLTVSTPYGVFYQWLESETRRDRIHSDNMHQALKLCLEEQWGVQEGAATYTELCCLQDEDPSIVDRAISELPTILLGQPPYREWFDEFSRILPISSPDLSTKARRGLCILLASYAMHNRVLERFEIRTCFTLEEWETYLSGESPNRRLRRVARSLIERPKVLDGIQQALGDGSNAAQQGLAYRILAEAHPELEFVHPDQFAAQCAQFLSLRPDIISAEPNTTGAVHYPSDWQASASFPKYQLTPARFRSWLEDAGKQRVFLSVAVTMYKPDEVHIAAMPSPLRHTQSESWAAAVEMLKSGSPAAEGVFPVDELREVLRPYSGTPVVLSLLRDSWRFWDQLSPPDLGLSVIDRSCWEFELSEERFIQLLKFRGLYEHGESTIRRIVGDHYVGLVLHSENPSIYAQQSVRGEVGLVVYQALIEQLGLPMNNDRDLQQLPNWYFIRLNAQGLLPADVEL